jgi:hypothetical protein
VYPVFESLDISSVSRVRPAPLRALRFLLDVHVGRLAAYLRMAGFDALYSNQASDPELAAIVAREGRVLLTRDRYLLMRTAVDRGYWVRSTEPKQQLLEVVKRFDLARSVPVRWTQETYCDGSDNWERCLAARGGSLVLKGCDFRGCGKTRFSM